MSTRFIGRRISRSITNQSIRHHVRCLIHQNHFPDIRHVHTNSNPIARYRYLNQKPVFLQHTIHSLNSHVRLATNSAVEMTTDKGSVRFRIDKQVNGLQEREKKQRRIQVSKKAKLNELRFYRLKAKKKMRSPNPEVRILYRLGKAKRKEEWLIEKLRKFDVRKAAAEVYDPESLTEEEKFYLKRTGEKKKHYVPVGRRGVFGGVVLNMHLHWKNHETVKVVCKPCKPGQIHEYADELTRLSKGIVIDIKPNNVIIFYRGKNYVQPEIMSPPDTLSKAKVAFSLICKFSLFGTNCVK
ncbi:putative CRM domain-containing protein [Helianthus annuus]|nr:putative CRM domain-containing protein [Helianthus annuus]